MTLEEGLLYYFKKIPPCGFTHQTKRFVFCQPIVRMALSQVPEPHCLLTRAASMEHIYPSVAIGRAVSAGFCACVGSVLRAGEIPGRPRALRPAGYQGEQTTVTKWRLGDKAGEGWKVVPSLPGHGADLQNWPRPCNFTDSAAEGTGSLVWAFITWSKMCREGW